MLGALSFWYELNTSMQDICCYVSVAPHIELYNICYKMLSYRRETALQGALYSFGQK